MKRSGEDLSVRCRIDARHAGRSRPFVFEGKSLSLHTSIGAAIFPEDGTEVEARGDQEIEYDGEMHTAANLYDALKEGYYGKF